MMRRSLYELIFDDLTNLANLHTDVVASEETIRLMIDVFTKKGQINNSNLINLADLYDFLKGKMNDSSFIGRAGHFQFVVEVGNRHKSQARNPAKVHYCALDLYIRPGKKPLAFVTDHLRVGYYPIFSSIEKDLDIQVIVAGGRTYQADAQHCPVFTLQHLIRTSADTKMLPLLEGMIPEVSKLEKPVFGWDKLSPMYMVYSQSVSTLWDYVEKVKAEEGTQKEVASTVLKNSQFVEYLKHTLYPVNSGSSKGKIRNKAIKYHAATLAGDAVLALENDSYDYDTEKLIEVFYKQRYPLVYELLMSSLKIEKDHPYLNKKSSHNLSHPLFEFAFYHAHILEKCLTKPDLNNIFNNEAMLILMHNEVVDPFKLLHQLTYVIQDREVNKQMCRTVCSNLNMLTVIVKCKSHVLDEIDLSVLYKLLKSNSTKAFFDNSALVELFSKGLIVLEDVGNILPYQIDENAFGVLKDDEKVKYLEEKFFKEEAISTSEPDKADEQEASSDEWDEYGLFFGDNNQIDDESDDSCLFEVPVAQEIKPDPFLPKRPKINAGLLAQSMEQSVFSGINNKDCVNISNTLENCKLKMLPKKEDAHKNGTHGDNIQLLNIVNLSG